MTSMPRIAAAAEMLADASESALLRLHLGERGVRRLDARLRLKRVGPGGGAPVGAPAPDAPVLR